jgi:hypothetical protein
MPSNILFIIIFSLSIVCILLFLVLCIIKVYKFDLFKLLCVVLYILIVLLLYFYNEKEKDLKNTVDSVNYYLANLSPHFNLTDLNGNTITYP